MSDSRHLEALSDALPAPQGAAEAFKRLYAAWQSGSATTAAVLAAAAELFGSGSPRYELLVEEVQQRQPELTSGNCFQAAVQALMRLPIDSGAELVHGLVTGSKGGPLEGVRYAHAWVEVPDGAGSWIVGDHSNGNDIELPREVYYWAGKVRPEQTLRYDRDRAMGELAASGHNGPWDVIPGDEDLTTTAGTEEE